jgi:hypothetical protein
MIVRIHLQGLFLCLLIAPLCRLPARMRNLASGCRTVGVTY